jgi:alanine racemase
MILKPKISTQFIRPDLQAHISSEALLNNVSELRKLCKPGTKFCAVVKANAYGHGMAEIVTILKDGPVDFFAVASVFEALHIAPLTGGQPILILEPVHVGQPPLQILCYAEQSFHCPIATLDTVDYINSIATPSGKPINVHVKVETGMGRCGLDPDLAVRLIEKVDKSPSMCFAGLYTHFATADESDLSYAQEQLGIFNDFIAKNGIRQHGNVIIHACNSAAAIKMPEAHFDMVRCGISLYGYFSRPQPDSPVKLQPVMCLQAPIVQLKRIAKGKSVSYGRSFITKRDSLIGIVPLGYADGYRRCFSNRASMKLGSALVPVVGRVCMDQLLVDVTDVQNVSLGQMVTIIDDVQDSPCGAYALADLADTICYEILTCVHAHVKRVVY